MAWPPFMQSSFPSSASSDHAPKPSSYFLNGASDLSGKNGFRSVDMDSRMLQNLYEGETAGPAPEAAYGGAKGDGSVLPEVTLEAFLTKSMMLRADDAKEAHEAIDRVGGQVDLEDSGNQMVAGGAEVGGVAIGGGERGRGRKRPPLDSVDRAAMQRQKRMIKNRESAARSRERKQQYTNQLEQTVFKLEEENALLLKEREELLKWRFKQVNI
ncbi:ABSCISIC ACID-INSENSITIVE 5-like protein 3 [Platanthera guangdongensis]|uniref:ABSCISIC ACID-INSENSITIVE 5-like protein 3 n=1 Tax=Platanthera guangdongensis TaxID=2320717 RepID=A0ABR2MV29_9ASPA